MGDSSCTGTVCVSSANEKLLASHMYRNERNLPTPAFEFAVNLLLFSFYHTATILVGIIVPSVLAAFFLMGLATVIAVLIGKKIRHRRLPASPVLMVPGNG